MTEKKHIDEAAGKEDDCIISPDPDPVTGLWEDGAVVVVSEEGCWDGKGGFVQGWVAAHKTRPCTKDYLKAIEEAERVTGKKCCSAYIQPN